MNNLNSENLARAEQSLNKLSHDAGEALGSFASDIPTVVSDYTKKSKIYVSENPSKSLALATAAGVLIGGLFTLAMRRRD